MFTPTKTDTFAYDRSGRMASAFKDAYANTVSFSYDAGGRVAAEQLFYNGSKYTVSFEYDTSGNLTVIRYPDGRTVSSTFGSTGRLESVDSQANGVVTNIVDFTYDDGQRLQSFTQGNGIITNYTYRPDNLVSTCDTPSICRLDYVYDSNRNITSVAANGVPASTTRVFGRDALDRITTDTVDGESIISVAFDDGGAWSSITRPGTVETRTLGQDGQLTAVMDNQGHQSRIIAYDARGNLSDSGDGTQYSWDPDDLLETVSRSDESTSFKYDAFGRRICASSSNGMETVFVHGGTSMLAKYLYHSTVLSNTINVILGEHGLPVCLDDGAEQYFLHRDASQSTIAISNSAGQVVESYTYDLAGKPTIYDAQHTSIQTSQVQNESLFRGRLQFTESDLYYLSGTFYHPALGMSANLGTDFTRGINGYALQPSSESSLTKKRWDSRTDCEESPTKKPYCIWPRRAYTPDDGNKLGIQMHLHGFVRGYCGGFSWKIKWKKPKPAPQPNGSYIIQHIVRRDRVWDCDGKILSDQGWDFYEAWQFAAGSMTANKVTDKKTGRLINVPWDDEYGNVDGKVCTKGHVSITGWYTEVKGTIPKELFNKPIPGPWHNLPATTTPPHKFAPPLNFSERHKRAHSLGVTWDCCKKKKQTKTPNFNQSEPPIK